MTLTLKALSFFAKGSRAVVLGCLVLAVFAVTATAQMPPLPKRVPVSEQLAAVPDLDRRLADLEKALNAAADKNSLTATTALYILDVTKEAGKMFASPSCGLCNDPKWKLEKKKL